jgi:hypothetical protein
VTTFVMPTEISEMIAFISSKVPVQPDSMTIAVVQATPEAIWPSL